MISGGASVYHALGLGSRAFDIGVHEKICETDKASRRKGANNSPKTSSSGPALRAVARRGKCHSRGSPLLREEKTYSAAEVRARVATCIVRYSIQRLWFKPRAED